MKSTYDAVVQEAEFNKTELEMAREEQKALARQVTSLEGQNREVMRDAEATVAAAQQAKTEAETQRRTAEEQQARLKQKLAQLVRQQAALRDDLHVAKENTGALQELADVYQRKIREQAAGIGTAGTTREVARAPEPFNPATLPSPEVLPSPKAAPEPAAPPAATSPTPPAPPAPRAPEPEESGWFSAIKEWVVSLWRSVFS
ncbi:MAG: hypothetical protein ACM34B_07920 [Nitrospira sp.]